MSPSQAQTTPAPLPADIYSESIEQQFAIIHDFLLTPVGTVLLANDLWVRRRVATPSELARHIASRVYRSKPFFVTAPITQSIFSASQTLPEYTFTAESFPCPKAFVWLQEPICRFFDIGVGSVGPRAGELGFVGSLAAGSIRPGPAE